MQEDKKMGEIVGSRFGRCNSSRVTQREGETKKRGEETEMEQIQSGKWYMC